MVEMMGVEPISETLHFGFTPRRNHSIPILAGVLSLATRLLPAPSALVLRLGLEPRSRRLRVACNTIILTKHKQDAIFLLDSNQLIFVLQTNL